jgi:hypothetical protein
MHIAMYKKDSDINQKGNKPSKMFLLGFHVQKMYIHPIEESVCEYVW